MAHQVSESMSPSNRGAAKRPRHTFWWYLKWFFITIQVVLFCVIVATVAVLYGVYNRLNEIVPNVRSITVRTKAAPTIVYAADGSTLAKFQGEYRDWVDFADLQRKVKRNGEMVSEPGYLAAGTVAVEDWRFYSHMGMDPIRITKAAIVNFTRGRISQGGSTITEQLATNLYLTRTRTVARRLQEALLALKLERTFSKDEILTLYLNEIYYGNNAYGCEAASQRYFNKPVGKLSIAQAAFLAGLPNSPSNFDPFDHFDRAKKRQRVVLHAMVLRHKINYTQYIAALKDKSLKGEIKKSKIRYKTQRTSNTRWRAPYFVAYVKKYLQRNYHWSDEFLTKGGLKIYTTLDPDIQKVAKRVMDRRLGNLSPKNRVLQGAMVCIDPWTGHIIAMYGGRDFYDAKMGGQYNRATMAKRQPGSTFKPYLYATAMEAGYTPDSIVVDKPYTVEGHEVHNDDHRYRGPITFKTALAISDNVAATRILMKLGISSVVAKAHQFGISSTLHPVPSLALGTSEITVLENTSAFGVFATGGLRADPTPITRVDDSAGETLVQQATPVQAVRVISSPSAKEMQQMLHYVVTNGTGRRANIPGLYVMGKTGTTSDDKDVWFMGATKLLSCGVWMGYDTPHEMYGASGGGWCGPAWRSFMEKANSIWSKRNPLQETVERARATQIRRNRADEDKKPSGNSSKSPPPIGGEAPSRNRRNRDNRRPSTNQSPPDQSTNGNSGSSIDQPTNDNSEPPTVKVLPTPESPSSQPRKKPRPQPSPSAPVRRYYNNGDSGNIRSGDSSPIPNQ